MASPLAAVRAQSLSEDAERHFIEQPGKLWIPDAAGNSRGDPVYDSVDEAFPDVTPPFAPAGSLVMIQMKVPAAKTTGTFNYGEMDRKTDRDNMQVGKVVRVGALAFCNRETREPWPEGAWCKAGDFVRVPKYQGDRVPVEYIHETKLTDDCTGETKVKRFKDTVEFVTYKDLAITGVYPDAASALAARAFL
jgi:hypothetical protein